jgi:hypothetical protein
MAARNPDLQELIEQELLVCAAVGCASGRAF